MDKAYEPKKYEDSIYESWEESGFFNPDNLSGEPYAIMMPPPNVTGVLHLGHALENSLMDIMARYQRMQGKKVLLLPGTDHAAVATQARVEKNLVEAGMKNPREELGREGLLKKIREYSEQSKATILKQIKKMGTSADWSRLAYTFDEERSKAVNTVFVKMYNDGLIYRGFRVVNWSVKGQSTCSDDELVYIDREAKLYTFKYSKDFPITIATTRPETKLGDTAVAVNPNDKRYKKFIGKIFPVNFCGVDLKIKIIADEHVEMEFGTGALGVTPAHSGVDFEMYEKKKAEGDLIELIQVIDEKGKMTSQAGEEFVGKTVLEARDLVVEKLRAEGLMEKEEEIEQNVGTSDRFGDVVEAIPMTQWFVDVNKEIPGRGKSLKTLMKEAVSSGLDNDKNKKVTITPNNFVNIYFNWIDNLRDWCISRQIWWGHQIPVWYRKVKSQKSKVKSIEDIYVGVEEPKDIENWTQDSDTLDTWFSSGLWTFSTLGWPNDTADFKTFHPTNWMQMGHEILFFWMARMILFSGYLFDNIPFKDVYIHGILRDKDGKKFSKSSGNGIDPLVIIENYGTDALRWSMLSGITPGNDSRFYTEKVEGSRNLVNKLWNVARFILANIVDPKVDVKKPEGKTLSDKWILEELDNIVYVVTFSLNNFEFSIASENLRLFTWESLADWYLEIAKIEGEKTEVLNYVLNTLLKLWHPFAPFVTEVIWKEVYGEKKFLMIEKWPEGRGNKERNNFTILRSIVIGIRSLRANYKIEPAKKLNITISAGDKKEFLEENAEIIKKLARLEKLQINQSTVKPINSVSFVESGIEVFVELAGVVDFVKEKEKLGKEIEQLTKYISGLEGKLNNPGFVSSAPENIVIQEKAKLAEAQEKLAKINKQFQAI
ncbi:MAG: valine--tRNA ligase [Candidatus Magasanikbacteria bacterium]